MRSLLPNLSLRWKIPLRVMFAVLGTALAVTVAMVAREREELRQSQTGHAKSLGRVLANTLVAPVLHDDLWRAFEIIQSARETDRTAPELQAEVILVLDHAQSVFVSSRPRDFPVGASLKSRSDIYAQLPEQAAQSGTDSPLVFESDTSLLLFIIAPLVADAVPLGHVVLGYSKSTFAPRFAELVLRSIVVTLLVLMIILPFSWYFARRTGEPLIALAEAMHQVPDALDSALLTNLPASRDEIGQLGEAFRRMVDELKKKKELESQMLVSERLAAVGRLSAGIAHEINNPLGGMLTAISTYQRHGSGDAMANQTLSLLERGLTQIRNTVAALLVETRTKDREFEPADIDDLLILIEPQAHIRAVRVVVTATLRHSLPLPANLLRQILLNLLINAVNAADEAGQVTLSLVASDSELHIAVGNDGQHIPEDRLVYLFEPFAASSKGNGLGLWIVYQIVQQLDGGLSVESEPSKTTFNISIPYGQTH
jgi:two-component system NtrC family sensor kinase